MYSLALFTIAKNLFLEVLDLTLIFIDFGNSFLPKFLFNDWSNNFKRLDFITLYLYS